ncbi:hypothetical protein Kpol_392p7 [Vanderwaltozyma polyspora DSM 70294]|uniref:Protein CSF1 n=1 Tax=Vanderwaltozyma polyspora (strain ATCC 22028 / DSM 70294 / BCRC 21397 / CBS 2163 / NBRC 10782 / NRRL Y-8283 / UCD 57-17) TaxID=436907 RepID=A7TRR8_VANPO|nr:uncharacterized protein Kpol_392p7 [Vanderwaltozyma polyspora DSM 70294]EDO15040.1 hypothetical protein Kpol_392p7 [Vanderwaltozyma polyspora DSM 70294]
MEVDSQFASISLGREKYFSWVFLAYWVLTCIASLTVIFYLPRVFGAIFTFILHWSIWKKYKVKINIESIRVSFLGGTVFIKNMSIINQDFTLSFLECRIKWRYWLLNSREVEYKVQANLSSEQSQGSDASNSMTIEKNSKLPCTILIECKGFEVFVYNRKAAYENVLRLFTKEEREKFSSFLNEHDLGDIVSEDTNVNSMDKDYFESVTTENSSESTVINDRTYKKNKDERKSILFNFLPIQLRLIHGAVTLGNRFTPSLVVASYENCNGVLDVSHANEKIDLYKSKVTMKFQDVNISVKPNLAYDSEFTNELDIDKGKLSRIWNTFIDIMDMIPNPFTKIYHKHMKKKEHDVESMFVNKWRGLSLYKDNLRDAGRYGLDEASYDFLNREYAKFSSILKCPNFTLSYYLDSPGIVPHGAHQTNVKKDGPDIGNSGSPPEFLVDLQVSKASIYYGPWTNRQVSYLIRMLSPVVSKNQIPIKKLEPGSRRIHTVFKMSVHIIDESSWRIPTREPSKDKEFIKQFVKTNDDFRPFGWLDFNLNKGTQATFNFSLIPTIDGLGNNFDIHFLDMEVTTSVNHDILLKSKEFDVVADIGYPLGWNSQADWKFDIIAKQLETFLLKEHISLFSDMFSDFASEDPTPYELFRPFTYSLNWDIEGYSIYLNVNDRNIVNNPLDFNENCYLSLHGDELHIDSLIPNLLISQPYTEIAFNIYTPMFRLLLNTPPWNTLSEFMKDKEVGRAFDFGIEGSYLIYSDLDIDNVDTITMECTSRSTTLFCYGVVIRYLMNVQANYFGDFVHFITSEEYSEILQKNNKRSNDEQGSFTYSTTSSVQNSSSDDTVLYTKEQDLSKPHVRRADVLRTENELDIWFTFRVWDGALILPEGLYNGNLCSSLLFSELMISFRGSNYYMDFLTNLYDMKINRFLNFSPDEIFRYVRDPDHNLNIVHGTLSDVTIHAHRMFGLPPNKLTYFCQWSIDFGSLIIDSNIEFLSSFFGLFTKLGFGYSNLENKLVYKVESSDDMTLLTLYGEKVLILVSDDVSQKQASLEILKLKLNSIDFQNERYSKRINLKIPEFSISIFDVRNPTIKPILLGFKTKIDFTNFVIKEDFRNSLNGQRTYITLHDSPYHRCFFILPTMYQESFLYNELYGGITPSFSIPILPIPMLPNTIDFLVEDFLKEYSDLLENPFLNIRSINNLDTSSLFNEYRVDTYISEKAIFKAEEKNTVNYDPKYEYDNYILNVEYIRVDINPLFSDFIDSMSTKLYSENMVDIIDEIEMIIVRRLGSPKKVLLRETNLKLKISYVDIFWGSRNSEGIEIYLDKLDFEMRQRIFDDFNQRSLEERTILSKLKSLRCSFSETQYEEIEYERPPALSLTVEGLEVWSCTNTAQSNSINILSTDITVDGSQTSWLIKYLNKQVEFFYNLKGSVDLLQKRDVTLQKSLISKLTTASEYYQIDHDPYVITKPALIMRLSNSHVRENRSWRIVTRLRHILNYLPEGWEKSSIAFVEARHVYSDSDPKNVFLSVFSNWRNWEVSDVARSYIYRRVFLPDIEKNLINNTTKIGMESFYFTIYSQRYAVDHNIVVTRINVIIDQMLSDEEPKAATANKNDKIYDITGTVGTFKGELGDQLIRLKKLYSEDKAKIRSEKSTDFSIPKFFKINIVLIVEKGELTLAAANTKLISRIKNGKISGFFENARDVANASGSIVYYATRTELWLKHNELILLDAHLDDLFISVIAELLVKKPTILVNVKSSHLRFKALPNTKNLVVFLREFEREISKITGRLTDKDNKKRHTSTSPIFSTKKIDISFDINIFDISSEIVILSPFTVKHSMKELKIVFNREGDNDTIFSILDADLYLTSYQNGVQYFRLSYQDINLEAMLTDSKSKLITINIVTSLIKLTLADPKKITNSLLQDEKTFEQSLESIKTLNTLFSSNREVRTSAVDNPYKFMVNFDLTYFGLLFPVDTSYFILELHSLLATFSNVYMNPQQLKEKITCNLALQNTLFMIKSPEVNNQVSKVLDFSVNLSTETKILNSKRSFEVESSHFRVCLNPESLLKILQGVFQTSSSFKYYKEHTRLQIFKTKKKASVVSENLIGAPLIEYSIHFLSYNFCIGWIFENSQSSYPGLIMGYDRLFSAYEDSYGKLTVVDGFFSIANGFSSDTFYSQGNEKEKYNRSYLPNLQILYWLKEVDAMKQLFVRFYGETIDVRFLSNFATIINLTIESVQHFQMIKKETVREMNVEAEKKVGEDDISTKFSLFFSKVQRINCQCIYDGGVFTVYPVRGNHIDTEHAIEITTPKVIIDVDYKYRIDMKKPHWIRSFINIEPTYNTLLSQFASFLTEFGESVHEMVAKFSPKEQPPAPKTVSPPIDYKRILEDFDVSFSISAGKQKVSLSCEPVAKVHANVGFESFVFSIITNDDDPTEPLSCSLTVNDIKTSINHEFSTEPTASFSVDFVDITTLFTHPDIYGTTLISDVSLYFNIKQLQNLMVFLDIWNLKRLIKLRPQKSVPVKKPESRVSSSTKSSSNTTIIPWSFTVIITDINGDIHLGPSLGNLSLKLKKNWISTNHFQDRRKALRFFTDSLSLTSVGRLGGLIDVANISWILNVRYVENEKLDQSPLVDITLNVENVAVKAAFDYHMFLIGRVHNILFNLESEKDLIGNLPDLLKLHLVCDEIDICSTALVASNILDISNTISRTRQDSRNSYIETLLESNPPPQKSSISYTDILKSLNLLRTDVGIEIHKMQVQISPISLFDVEVIVTTVENVSARSVTQSGEKLMTDLQMKIYKATLSLSKSNEELDEEAVSEISVDDYMIYAMKLSGGKILSIPKLFVGMTTWQLENSKIIEYLFACKFHDKISVRWNLGPVNFIKEVWATHVKSLAVRRAQLKGDKEPQLVPGIIGEPSPLVSSEELEMLRSESSNADNDNNEYSEEDKFIYVPLKEPQIEMPKIKDLEDATPPLEWFGVNRKKFPRVTHQTAIILIQKIVHVAQKEYAKVLGDS